jgi:hypothetical protein
MRAGLATSNRAVIEPVIRRLIQGEGAVVTQRPHWARSRQRADLYIQLGEWMLLIVCSDKQHWGRYVVVTIVNGPGENTWRVARQRRYISTPPPPRFHPPSRLVTFALSLFDQRPGESRRAAFRRTLQERRDRAQSGYERTLLERCR